ncbi:MAG: 3-phosphoshikimate 1-carboxyvinyltransferase [Coriobacteriia bacterium]|nr:3-phosphoshikimate 1-carboxyvinyltransferase [Coriobacteriia bacterium]
MIRTVRAAAGPLTGTVRVPGDKSISHRAVLFAAMSDGSCRLEGVLDSEDIRATMGAVSMLGAAVRVLRTEPRGLTLEVDGWGAAGPVEPPAQIDCGNSGTTARLLLGVLAGWDVAVTLTGDSSLSRRPMRRVTEPLTLMGARVTTSEAGTLPVSIRGGALRAARVEMSVASAQVKSAVLLAGLRAQGRTVVIEPAPSRDHTERMLPAFGVGVGRRASDNECWVDGPVAVAAADLSVPGDPSSAAFVVAAALLVAGSSVTVTDVALNPTRTGFLSVLARMGGSVTAVPGRASGAEPAGAITANYGGDLRGVLVTAEEVPSLVDEVPVLAVVAAHAVGVTRFEGVGELRVKESDRLEAVRAGLSALGATVRCGEDWLEVEGPTRLCAASLSSLGDHRLAMAFAVAGLVADGPVTIEGWEAVAVSYPRFAEDLTALGAMLSC